MKRYRLYIMAGWLMAWVMTLAGCSADALSEETPDKGTGEAMSGESYINLHIVNNSQPQTRTTIAATREENAIYDGILCIFEGSNEATATLKTAVVIDQLINNPGLEASSQSLNVTQRLATDTHPYSGKRYVLALLNTTSTGFAVGGTNNNKLYFSGTDKTGCTISQIQSLTINSVGSTDKHVGLFMSNAPQTGYIMPEVTSTYLFNTPSAAATGSHLTINVERAAAKVKVANTVATVSAINLNKRSSDVSDRHPSVHQMTWTVNKYNTQSYAIRTGYTAADNWATSVNSLTTYTAEDFSLYPQQSHSLDAVYIGENTTATETEIIVEVQLKDESNMLMHECFVFRPFDDSYVENAYTNIYTNAEQYIAYLRDELPPANKAAYGLSSKNNSEIFKYATVKMNSDGSVVITLVNSDFTSGEQEGLDGLATFLSNHTTGFRDGKMYYTYKIKHNDTPTYGVVRNNAYNLTLQNINAIGRPTP